MDKKNEADLDRFRSLIAGMAITFRQEASQVMYDGYWLGLADLPIEAVELAVVAALRTCKFMPSASELRELAGEVRMEHRAVKAWAAFREAIDLHGYYHSVDFDDPVVNATVRALGGWVSVSELMDEPEAWIEGIFRKRFEQTYVGLATAGVSATAAVPLIGSHEQDKRLKGYEEAIGEPYRIACGLPPHPVSLVASGKRAEVAGKDRALLEHVGEMPFEAGGE